MLGVFFQICSQILSAFLGFGLLLCRTGLMTLILGAGGLVSVAFSRLLMSWGVLAQMIQWGWGLSQVAPSPSP